MLKKLIAHTFTLALGLVVVASALIPTTASAQDRDEQEDSCQTIALSECFKLTPFAGGRMPRKNNGNVMYFDYPYQARQEIVIVCKSPYGDPLETTQFTRTENIVKHFEMPTYQGDALLIQEIRRFVDTKHAFECGQ